MAVLSRIPQRKWVTWLMAALLFTLVVTQYRLWTYNIDVDIESLTQSTSSYLNESSAEAPPPPQTNPSPDPAPSKSKQGTGAPKSAEAAKKMVLDLPEDYTELTEEDQLCEDFFTEKYIQTIASNQTVLCDGDSRVTEFAVPTHPHHRKLNMATPLWLLQGVRWDSNQAQWVAKASGEVQVPTVYGSGLGIVRYDENVTSCPSSRERQVVVYPALWEGNFPNIWHRLMEIWQNKLNFDAIRIALDPATGQPYLDPAQTAAANVVLPADAPGPWGDLWKIVTPSPAAALPPSSLVRDACYDVVVPSVGWAHPMWSALLTSHHAACPRQTLVTRFAARVMAHYGVAPLAPAAVAARPPAITVVQRSDNRKFRDLDALLDKIHARHPDAPVNVVDLALLDTAEQIALAQNTDVWVGHHGAGMTNILFMPRHAAVVEIVPPIFVSRAFRWVARMRGLVHFIGRAMWQVEYEEKYDGKPRPPGWVPKRQEDSDMDNWQLEEWVWISHDVILDLIDAAMLSQKERMNDIPS